MSCQRSELDRYLNECLPTVQKDYCPNGLQVEGKDRIDKLILGVTANQALIDQAVYRKADAILVHHGLFWKADSACLTGTQYQRVAALIRNDVNLWAYHLPLDTHPIYGNNVQLAKQLDWQIDTDLQQTPVPLVLRGHLNTACTVEDFSDQLQAICQRAPLVVGQPTSGKIERIAWCTGAAQSFFKTLLAEPIDAFITGEISEPIVHLARESGIAFVAAGHHATERYAVQAMGTHLAEVFELDVEYIDIDSPV